MIIGKKGADIEKLRTDVSRMIESDVHLNIVEIRKPELDARLVAENISQQLERRVMFRRAMKRAVQSATRQIVDQIIAEMGESPSDLRDKALITVAYDTLARRGELVALDVEDIALGDDTGTVLIRRGAMSKLAARQGRI